MRQKIGTSERRSCKTIGVARSTLRYEVTPDTDDSLRLALIRLAKQYGRYGYRKIAELLRTEGWIVNHKRVERIWREEGLQLPQRHKKRKRLYHKDSSIIRLRPKYPNHIWSIDFVHDKLAGGRPYKMLTVLDEYTREALCVTAKPRMGNVEVLEALYPLFLTHGKPEFIRSDIRLSYGVADLHGYSGSGGVSSESSRDPLNPGPVLAAQHSMPHSTRGDSVSLILVTRQPG